MSTEPRAALDRLVAALEAHFLAAQGRRGEQDPAVEHAFAVLADAFETYDDALFDAYGETTPFEIYDEPEDEEDIELDDELDDTEDLDLDDSDDEED
ncbi:MAG: primosomal protein [Micrococcales bacterium]|nr:MAG: primosomal protein [Micrococcales bacterium]PIE27682.1 MAG: primosomal protein [Micrococcales bacterium]